MTYNSITPFSRFYIYFETLLFFISFKLIKESNKIFQAKQQLDITLNRILKRGSSKNLDGFLKTTKKILKKKSWLANTFKQKSSIDEQNFKIVIIDTFDNLSKKNLPILTLAPIFAKYMKDVAIAGVDA